MTSTTRPRHQTRPLRSDLIGLCRIWLDIDIGHENESYLRGLVDYVVTPYAIRSK